MRVGVEQGRSGDMHVRLHIPMYSAPARDMGLPGLVAYHVMCVCGLSFFFLSFFFPRAVLFHLVLATLLLVRSLSLILSLPRIHFAAPSSGVKRPSPPAPSHTVRPCPFNSSNPLRRASQACLRSTYLSCLCIPSWTCFGHRSCWRRSSKLDPHLVTYSFRLPRNPPPY